MKSSRLIGCCLAVAGLLVSASAAAEPIAVNLELVRLPGAEEMYAYYSEYGYQHLYPKAKKPHGVVIEAGCQNPVFGVLTITGKKGGYSFALGKKPGSQWYELLFIDTNEDGTFSVDERFETQADIRSPVNIHPAGIFTPVFSIFVVDMPFNRPSGSAATYTFQLQARTYKERESDISVTVLSKCYRKGVTVIDGTSRELRLLDLTMNGRFDDFAKRENGKWVQGDGIAVMPEGEAKPDYIRAMESLSPMRVIGKDAYRVAVTEDCSRLVFEPAVVRMGQLIMKPVAKRLDVQGELGIFTVMGSGDTLLPAGKYRLAGLHYQTVMSDASTWSVSSINPDRGPVFEIRADKKTKLPFGPPFRTRVTYEQFPAFKVELQGWGGEKYSYNHLAQNNAQIPTPDVVIKNHNGKLLARLKRQIQTSVDAIPPDYAWGGPVPEKGAIATCNLGLPWKAKLEPSLILPPKKEQPK